MMSEMGLAEPCTSTTASSGPRTVVCSRALRMERRTAASEGATMERLSASEEPWTERITATTSCPLRLASSRRSSR